MKLYSIMPLDVEHLDEICQDIKEQYDNGVTTCALFSMNLTPEGDPVTDKAATFCEKYKLFKEKLDAMGVSTGVLVQASIGHGYLLGESAPFQQYTSLPSGDTTSTYCPYDEGFREYIKKAFITIAKCKPDHIMLDDDFRLLTYRGDCRGCGCPLHMAKFNEYANENLTREELVKIIDAGGEKSDEYCEIVFRTQKESLLEAAQIMRDAIDSVDPTIPGSYCCVSANAEFGDEIAEIMAGKGNPVQVRINNGHYTQPSNHHFSDMFLKAAQQIEKLKDKVDVILAETDTCPHNRYSTGAMSVHTHFTGTILEGAAGAKHWITHLLCHEPESGKAYRKVLTKYKGFYQTLSELSDKLDWCGFRIPVNGVAHYDLKKPVDIEPNAFSSHVIERLGLPMYYSSKMGGVACLEGDYDKDYSDEEILDMLRVGAFISSDSAKRLIDRGFGKYIGVDVRKWEGKPVISEKVVVNGNYIRKQVDAQELVPLSDDVLIDSMMYNTLDRVSFEYLFPGTTIYKNSLGGTVVVFAGTPKTIFNHTTAFSFLCYSRKQQFIKIMKDIGQMPVYYPGDEEVYLKAAKMQDGSLFAAVFNLGYDPIEELTLCCDKEVKKVEMLTPEGIFEEIGFTYSDGAVKTATNCYTLTPVILKLSI